MFEAGQGGMSMKRGIGPVAVVIWVLGCAPGSPTEAEHRAALLSLHQTVMTAHLEGDIEPWMAIESDDYVSANRGEITFPTKAERRAARAPYLTSTRFHVYRDLRDPIVTVSSDGTLGWVIAEVEGEGLREGEDGHAEPMRFISAWIELYRRDGEAWALIGNVSNFRPAAERP